MTYQLSVYRLPRKRGKKLFAKIRYSNLEEAETSGKKYNKDLYPLVEYEIKKVK